MIHFICASTFYIAHLGLLHCNYHPRINELSFSSEEQERLLKYMKECRAVQCKQKLDMTTMLQQTKLQKQSKGGKQKSGKTVANNSKTFIFPNGATQAIHFRSSVQNVLFK